MFAAISRITPSSIATSQTRSRFCAGSITRPFLMTSLLMRARTLSSTAMRTAIPFSTWFRMAERCESATSEEISRPRLMGPGCMTITSGLASSICSGRKPEELKIFVRRKGGFMLPLQLHAQHHDHVDIANGFFHVGGEFDARRDLCHLARQQRGRSAQHNLRAEFRKQKNVGPRHPAVRDVADDGDAQAFERAAAVENRERIEQRLRRMLVRAVAGVDDRNRQIAREKMRRAGSRVAHHDRVGPHGAKRIQRIDQRFAFRNAGTRSGDGKDVGAQAAWPQSRSWCACAWMLQRTD